MLGLTFANETDYDLIQEADTFNFVDISDFKPGEPLTILITHENGTSDSIQVHHTYNHSQIGWFRAGSALNVIKQENAVS